MGEKKYTKTVNCSYCNKEKVIDKYNKSARNFCDYNCLSKQWKKDKRKTTFFNKRENHPSWKGGRRKSSTGYIEIYCPDHHRARKNGYVYEHIVVLEKKLGIEIKRKDGHVHHIDENKTNNHPYNLTLMDGKKHISMHNKGAFRFPPDKLKIYSTGSSKSKKKEGYIVTKERLPRGYYFMRIID